MSNLNEHNPNRENLRTTSSGEGTKNKATASLKSPESVSVYFSDLSVEKQEELEASGYDGTNSPPFPLFIFEKESEDDHTHL